MEGITCSASEESAVMEPDEHCSGLKSSESTKVTQPMTIARKKSIGKNIPSILVTSNTDMTSDDSFLSTSNEDVVRHTRCRRRSKKTYQKQHEQGKRETSSRPEISQESDVVNGATSAVSCDLSVDSAGCEKIDLASARKVTLNSQAAAMERVDYRSSEYTSDEDDEYYSNSDEDHTDSSDDDDPKSQVDRLIERGTLIYMEAENSALSSEDDSDVTTDSESDITDVSPLGSPLYASPILPRRQMPTSPLAMHDNRELNYDPRLIAFHRYLNQHRQAPERNHVAADKTDNSNGALGMDPILQAVIELENKNNAAYNLNNRKNELPKECVNLHPIRDNPHHSHLKKSYPRRKNMSFNNEEVRSIDRNNKILLQKIMATQNRPHHHPPNRHSSRASNSSVNRRRNEDKVRKDNLMLLKKIEDAKPSTEVAESRKSTSAVAGDPLAPTSAPRNIPSTPPSSCGAFLRSISQTAHSPVPQSRKETAL